MLTSLLEDFKSRDSSEKLVASGQSSKKVREHKRLFIAQFTASTDDGATCLNLPGLPKIYDQHPNDPGAQCNVRMPRPREGHPKCWNIELAYTTDMPPPPDSSASGGRNPVTNPPDRSPRYSLGGLTVNRVVEIDVNGKPVVNSAGQKFDPPLEEERYIQVVRVQRVESGFALESANTYVNKINAGDFNLNGVKVLKGTAKMAPILQQQFYENGRAYYDTTYELHIDPDGWRRHILDQGTLKKGQQTGGSGSSATFAMLTITDAFGQPVNHPVNLNGAGKPLADGANPVFLDFDTIFEADFSQLSL